MRRKEALETLQGKFGVLVSPSWGAYLCGPLEITSDRPWRAQGLILQCVGLPEGTRVPKEEGMMMSVGGCNVMEDKILEGPPTETYMEHLREVFNQAMLAIVETWGRQRDLLEEIKARPDGMEVGEVSHRNVKKTPLRSVVEMILTTLHWVGISERDLLLQLQGIRAKGFLVDMLPAEAELIQTKDDRQNFVQSLTELDLGPVFPV